MEMLYSYSYYEGQILIEEDHLGMLDYGTATASVAHGEAARLPIISGYL